MDVRLIEYTGRPDPWRAVDVMIFTKGTRVEMSPDRLEEVAGWPEAKKREELAYMANTIPSSWEFCDYTFMIMGVTRALTHQLVRARTMSFAQQTMQILDMSQGAGWTFETGPTIVARANTLSVYRSTMETIARAYRAMVSHDGVKIEDARGVLPTNIHTNIVMKCNMRSLVELLHKRDSPRNLWEISLLMTKLKEVVLEVHPWMSIFIARTFDQAAADLDRELSEIADAPKRIRMMKLVDQMRSKS